MGYQILKDGCFERNWDTKAVLLGCDWMISQIPPRGVPTRTPMLKSESARGIRFKVLCAYLIFVGFSFISRLGFIMGFRDSHVTILGSLMTLCLLKSPSYTLANPD